MRILLDNIIFSLQKSGGISVVWNELIKYLSKKEKNIDLKYIEYNNSNNNLQRKELSISPNLIYLKSSLLLSLKRFLSPKIVITQRTIFHSSYYRTIANKNVINITTVHDFTYEYFSSNIKKRLHSWQKFGAIKKSDYIICISENTKKDLLKFIPQIDEKKIRVIYNGVSDDYYPIKEQISIKNTLPYKKNSFIIFVGGRKGYKNFKFAVSAIQGTEYKLVIVGSDLDKNEKVLLDKEIGVNNYIVLSYISNQELNTLYNNAFCLLYPSSYEGFGIPIVEAQKSGCPVIAYNCSSVPEVILDSGLLFNSLNAKEVKDCFVFLENETNKKSIISKGFENAKRFSWSQMAQKITELYDEAFKE